MARPRRGRRGSRGGRECDAKYAPKKVINIHQIEARRRQQRREGEESEKEGEEAPRRPDGGVAL